MLVVLVIFLVGKWFYKSEKLSDDNILFKFCGCIKTALVEKWRRRKSTKRSNYWLHNAVGAYDMGFVNDVSRVLRVSCTCVTMKILSTS